MSAKDRFHEADRLFEAALDLPASERSSYLDRACGGDGELRGIVDQLLRSIEETTSGALATGGALDAFPQALDAIVPDLSGSTLGRYEVLRKIGRGGMGVVYEARDQTLGRSVAIKVLSLAGSDRVARERFEREARAAAALNHPNVVAIYDIGEASGRPYLVMELVPGTSLEARPPESLEEAIRIARFILDALGHAHDRGLVHRDLKPANVLVTRDDGQLTVKLTDMGIALTRGAARVTQSGAITGTPTYMAPEQALGRDVDGRTDLYALGVMLYDWIAGRPPFQGDDALTIVSQHIHAPVVPPRTYRSDIPAGLETVVLGLLAKTPDERYASAKDVRLALEEIDALSPRAPVSRRVAIEGLARGRMVGRQREVALLQGLWRASAGGRCHMALVSGEPGVGKTRLAHEVTATARLDGARVLAGGCYENEASTPYLPFLEALRRLVRDRSDDELRELLGDNAAEIALLAPEIASRLGPFPAGASLSPQEDRLRLFDHVARFLGRLAVRKGLLVFIDDLQWADHGSVALLRYLLRHLGTHPVLFLGTYREVELDRAHALSKALVDWDRERVATRVRLDRLGLDDTALMVATLLGEQDVSREFSASLHEETEGNPFFVEEVLKALVAAGNLVHEGGGWRRQKTGEFVLPQSVKAAIGSRLERISPECSEILRTAAVLGKLFDFAELRSIARRSEDDLIDALDEAAAAQLIAPGKGEAFAFTHDKIREVLYEELNPIRRRRLHLAIAEGLERLKEQGRDVAVEDLAHHFVHSGDNERGLLYSRRAARAALGVFAWEEALEMLTRARECAEALERRDEVRSIDEALGDAAFASGEIFAAAEHFERAVAGSGGDIEAGNRARGKAAEAYAVAGDPRGEEHARTALSELDPERSPRETAQAMMVAARYHHLRGELDDAVAIYQRSVDLATPLGDWDLTIRLQSFLAGTYQHLADFERSDAAAERCIEIGESRNLPSGVMHGCEFLAENSFYRGWWRKHVSFNEREETLALECHAGERYGWAQFRAFSLRELGRLGEAVDVARRGIEHCERTGDRRLELFLKGCYATCLADLGEAEKAETQASRASKVADELNLVAHRIALRSVLGYVLTKRGRADDAAAASRTGLEIWQSSGSKGAGLIYGASFAEGLARAGHLDEARSALDAHLVLAEGVGAEHRIGQNLHVRGLVHAAEGRTKEAVLTLEEAVDKLAACESLIELARVLADRARILRADGLAGEADADLGRAAEILDRCGASRAMLQPRR